MSYSDGGLSMNRSYLCSASYYQKMSDYDFSDEQIELHKALYYCFLHKFYNKLHFSEKRNYSYIKNNP